MERGQRDEPANSGDDLLGDQGRFPEQRAAVDYPVPDAEKFRPPGNDLVPGVYPADQLKSPDMIRHRFSDFEGLEGALLSASALNQTGLRAADLFQQPAGEQSAVLPLKDLVFDGGTATVDDQ